MLKFTFSEYLPFTQKYLDLKSIDGDISPQDKDIVMKMVNEKANLKSLREELIDYVNSVFVKNLKIVLE